MQQSNASVRWPSRQDYQRAMQSHTTTIYDPELARKELKKLKEGMPWDFGHPDSSICLYKIDTWMIRCFCRKDDYDEPPATIIDRYRQLETFYQKHGGAVSALVPLKYIERGIEVTYYKQDDMLDADLLLLKKKTLPIVKMPFIEGHSLNSFIAANYRNRRVMEQLCQAWYRMICEMEAIPMAHGDLDLSNVLVPRRPSDKPIALKLIDYDNTWVPGFTYKQAPEHGHGPFQHPNFYARDLPFNAEIDRFSALVIYISLRAFAARPDLYLSYEADDTRLLFGVEDYQAQKREQPGRIARLRAENIPGLEPYLAELNRALALGCMPHKLEDIVDRQAKQRKEKTATASKPLPPTGRYHEEVLVDWEHVEEFAPRVPSPPLAQPETPVLPHQEATRIPGSQWPATPQEQRGRSSFNQAGITPSENAWQPRETDVPPNPPLQSPAGVPRMEGQRPAPRRSEPPRQQDEVWQSQALTERADTRRATRSSRTSPNREIIVGCSLGLLLLFMFVVIIILLINGSHGSIP